MPLIISDIAVTSSSRTSSDASRNNDHRAHLEDSSVAVLRHHAADIDRQYVCLPIHGKSRIKVESQQIRIGDDNFTHSEAGWRHIARRYGAPMNYWDQFEPGFRCEIAQYHVDRDDELIASEGHSGLEAVAFQDCFVGFRSVNHVYLDFERVVHAVIDALGPDGPFFDVNRLEFLNHTLFIELTTERLTHNVRTGDAVQGGISISHSIVGTTPTTVDLHVHRRVCSNGMNLRHCIGHTAISRSRRLKCKGPESESAAIDQIRRMVAERMSHLNPLFISLGQLPEARIEAKAGIDGEETMKSFLMPTLRATHLWSDDLWHRLLAPAWRHAHGGNGELHEFAAVNTVTYVATHQRDLSFRQRRTLARLAGLLSFRRVHICPRCHNAVVGS